MPSKSLASRVTSLLLPLWLAAAPAAAQVSQLGTRQGARPADGRGVQMLAVTGTRVVDPKLPGGQVDVAFRATTRDPSATVQVTVRRGGQRLRTLHRALAIRSGGLTGLRWDGRDAVGRVVPPGSYEVLIEAQGSAPLVHPVQVVRLGIREIAVAAAAATDEWQMVYFKRGTSYWFYPTPAVHEYLNTMETGELAELDHDDGTPREPVQPHADTRQPLLENGGFEDDRYNYPACFRAGAEPEFAVTFGATSLAPGGVVTGPGYPASGLRLRAVVVDDRNVAWDAAGSDLVPGTALVLRGPRLPDGVSRTDLRLDWRFESSADDGASWQPVAGRFATAHVLYTQPAAPIWAAGASGGQYAGPWVDVVERVAGWAQALSVDTSTDAGVIEALILGFQGQVGPLPNAIEGVLYDAYPLGGDGGASHYYLGFPPTNTVQLSRLLDGARSGLYVNCSDCAASTCVMASMLGVADLELVRLGPMTLRAIRGIGAPQYTLSLWGPSYNHAFSYHHIITRDGGVHVSDACLVVDEDGAPSSLPASPGHNVERVWARNVFGYMLLAASNLVTFSLDPIPRLQ